MMSLPVNSNNGNAQQQTRKMERRKAIRILPNSNEALQLRRMIDLLTTNNSGVRSNLNEGPDNDPYSSDSSVEIRIIMRLPEKKQYGAKSA